MYAKVTLFAAAVIFITPVQAQFVADFTQCTSRRNDKDRLACFDDAARKAAGGDTASGAGEAKTKEVIAASVAGEFKVISAEDLSVAPNKYVGKAIEMRKARCFHADKDEYRCIGSGYANLIIFTPTITPAEAKSQIEDKCGELKKVATSPLCQKTIRFTPAIKDSDTVSGYQQRTIIVAPSIEIIK